MLNQWIKNPKERKLIFVALIAAFVILAFGFWTIEHKDSLTANTAEHLKNAKVQFQHHLRSPLESYAKDKASLGRIGIFAAFAMFPLYFLLRLKKIKLDKEIKTFIAKVLKWVKLFHVQIAVIAFALITVHSFIMIFYEWKTNAVYLSGVVSYLLFIPLIIFGFMRYKRKDKNWHYYLSFAFVFSMLLHTFI
ncbi:hypothetical protein CON36_35315 [Bacillus cereus]|uniref:Uncharacterized protein n=1 Tax=Bacillus cereus TaxID=1396 RepID=A0A9X6XUV5_BACCE|nr:hypothetical protein [Bacillus cereus]PDZ94157.1 hypothetical protein CON36_35315 [Bacillus cereus]